MRKASASFDKRLNLGKPIVYLFLLFLSVSLPRAVWPGDLDAPRGEIINVSQHYKIAFTDMGKESLSPGDIVRAHISKEHFVYLKVIESSVALAKLGFTETKEFNTDPAGFKQIAIGNLVTKVLTGSREAGPMSSPPRQPDGQPRALSEERLQGQADEIMALREKLKEEQARNVELDRQLSSLASQRPPVDDDKGRCLKQVDDMAEVIQGLKARLKAMEKITRKALTDEKKR
jgi:hypothetical protein